MKLQTFMALLPLLLLSSITTITSRPTSLTRRGLSTNCEPLFGIIGCSEHWPFLSRPFLRSQTNSPPSIVVPSPPPPVFTNYPSFTPPLDDTNPSFLPLVASPPPPGYTFATPVVPQLSPPTDVNDDDDNDDDDDASGDSPFNGISFSPPQPEVTLPPIVERNRPDQFMSPPQENQPVPDLFNVSPPPPQDPGKQLPQLPPIVESPPAA